MPLLWPAQAAGGAAQAFTTAQSKLAADTAALGTNTWVTLVSVSLAAGTWLVTGNAVLLDSTNAPDVSIRIFDATSGQASSEVKLAAAIAASLAVATILVLAGTTTISLQAISNNGASTIAKAANNVNGTGNVATQINAIKAGGT